MLILLNYEKGFVDLREIKLTLAVFMPPKEITLYNRLCWCKNNSITMGFFFYLFLHMGRWTCFQMPKGISQWLLWLQNPSVLLIWWVCNIYCVVLYCVCRTSSSSWLGNMWTSWRHCHPKSGNAWKFSEICRFALLPSPGFLLSCISVCRTLC